MEPDVPAAAGGSSPPVPLRVSDHELLRRIGAGASGEVWLGRSITGEFRAVKVVRRDRFEHDRTYEREFTGLKKFEPVSRNHDGLVDVLQVGRNDAAGYFYYVMELADDAGSADGTVVGDGSGYVALTLAEWMRRRGRSPAKECARLGASVAEATGFLHASGLVHRDIKPSNIIFVGGRPKLADIGLVARLGEARSFVGTDGYIPPEGPGSPRADLFSLGKVLYEMVTARSRFDFPDLPVDLSVGEAGEFVELNEAILRACATEPDRRYGSAEEMRGELLLVDAGRSVRQLRRNERLLEFWRRTGMLALLLSLVGGAGLWFQRQQTRSARLAAEGEARQRREIEEKELRARHNLYAADMNLAQQAIVDGNYGRAEALLSANIPTAGQADLRGLEWYHFWHRVRGGSEGVLRGHEEVVSALAWSVSGDRLYSASFDTTVREWSVNAMQETRRWSQSGNLFMTMALDPSGGRLALEGGNRPRSAILSLAEGRWSTNVSTASPTILWLPGGTNLLRGANMLLFETNGVLEVVDERFRVLRRFEGTGGRGALRPAGDLLASGPWGDALRFWGWPSMEPRGRVGGVGTVMTMAFSPDGRHLACGSRDGGLRVVEVGTGEILASRQVHGGGVIWSLAYSPDGTRIATGGNDQTVGLWDPRTLESLRVYRGHGSEVWAVAWSPDGRRLASAGKDTTIRFWDPDPPQDPPVVPEVLQAPVFSPDERWVVTRSRPGQCAIRETSTGRVHLELPGVGEVGGFSADGHVLSVLTDGWRVEWRSTIDGRTLEGKAVRPIVKGLERRLLSADGCWLFAGLRNGRIEVEDVRGEGAPVPLSGHDAMVVSLAVSADGSRLLSGSMDRTARLWDVRARRELRTFSGHRMAVGAVAFALGAGDDRIATGSWDDTVTVWESSTGRKLAVLGGHEGGVQAVAFAPDGRSLISMTGASQLKFWSLAAVREAGVVRLPRGTRQSWVNVSSGGRWLGAVSQSGELSLLAAPRETGGEGP